MLKEIDGKLYLWTFGLLGWISAAYEDGEPPIITDIRQTIEKTAATAYNKLFEKHAN